MSFMIFNNLWQLNGTILYRSLLEYRFIPLLELLPITYGWLIELSDFIRVQGKYYFRDCSRICKYHNVRRILLWESHNNTAMYRIDLIAWSVLNLTIYLVPDFYCVTDSTVVAQLRILL